MFTRRKDKCCNGGNQHKFEPRYTEEVLTKLKVSRVEGNIGDLRRLTIGEVYVHDICKWCGKTIEKGGSRETI